jgi:hypothetical protein
MYKKYPAIKNWVDSLKEKGLTKEEILKEFNRVYQEYNKLRDLSEGGAIGNMQANNEGTKQIIDYLEKNNVETRPIVTGNFTKQPYFKINNIVYKDEHPNADILHNTGLYIGLPCENIYFDENKKI